MNISNVLLSSCVIVYFLITLEFRQLTVMLSTGMSFPLHFSFSFLSQINFSFTNTLLLMDAINDFISTEHWLLIFKKFYLFKQTVF